MNILLLASHAVAEFDDLRMFTDLGFDCFAPGGYEVPSRSGEGIRPPLPDAPHHPELVDAINRVRAERGEPGPAIDWGKAALTDEVIDWADAIIVHHFPVQWIGGQWGRIKHKRVIWRTCGQSDPSTEAFMTQFTGSHGGLNPNGGLQIVRYSPKEEYAFSRVNAATYGITTGWAGQDAVIRFGKYPTDYGPYIGDWEVIGNITQDMVERGDSVGLGFWNRFTTDWTGELPTKPAGKGSEGLRGGIGQLSYPDMLDYLRHIRVYLYLGTKPASYTLGLIEAMLSGVPVVPVGLAATGLHDTWLADISEAKEICGVGEIAYPDPGRYLNSLDLARAHGEAMRQRAIDLFDVATVGEQWREFLS